MGQFSWITQDTNRQIGNMRENRIPVYMTDDKGNTWFEDNYQGYGDFGGKDFYELLSEMNGGPSDRHVGIDMSFDTTRTDVKFPSLTENGEYFNGKQPRNDPDQGWYNDEDEDEDEDW